MSLDNVTPGSKVPEAFNVIIEIPMNADPIKYEVDKETGAIFVDRFMSTAMHYPTNYGYVPKTISGDGDPVDVLVITPVPLIPGVVVPCRAIGILKMTDEATGARQDRAEHKAHRRLPVQKQPDQHRQHHAHDANRFVLPGQVSGSAGLDGAGNFLHAGVARVLRKNPAA